MTGELNEISYIHITSYRRGENLLVRAVDLFICDVSPYSKRPVFSLSLSCHEAERRSVCRNCKYHHQTRRECYSFYDLHIMKYQVNFHARRALSSFFLLHIHLFSIFNSIPFYNSKFSRKSPFSCFSIKISPFDLCAALYLLQQPNAAHSKTFW